MPLCGGWIPIVIKKKEKKRKEKKKGNEKGQYIWYIPNGKFKYTSLVKRPYLISTIKRHRISLNKWNN